MTGGPPNLPTPSRAISLRDFAAVVFRRKWIVLTVLLVTTAVTAGIILSRPSYYESTGKVLVKRGVKDNIYGWQDRTLTWQEDLASEQETARSAIVLAEAQRLLDEKRRAAGRPRYLINPGGVEAGVVGESNVLGISYMDRNPAICVEVTNILLTAYTEYRKRMYAVTYPGDFFRAEAKRMEDELGDLQERRRKLLASGQLLGGDEDRQQMLNLSTLQKMTAEELEGEVTRMRAEIQQVRAYLDAPGRAGDPPISGTIGSTGAQIIGEIKRDLVAAQNRYTELSGIYTQDAPEIAQLQKQITALRASLNTEVSNWSRGAEGQLAAKEAQLRMAQSRFGETRQRIDAYPQQEAVLADIDRRIGALNYVYKELTDKSSLAQITKATSPEWTVLILSPASPPYIKNKQDYIRIALAPLFSLLIGLGLAFFIDSLDNSVRTPQQAESILELPVLATLAEQRKR